LENENERVREGENYITIERESGKVVVRERNSTAK